MAAEFSKADFWDDRYGQEEYLYGAAPNDFIRENASYFRKDASVLSLAEGEGRNAVFIAQLGCRVTGIDFSEQGRSKALNLAKRRGVSIAYEVTDIMKYAMGESQWDMLVSIFCHLPAESRRTIYRNIRKALKPGGYFLLESYNRKQLDYRTGGPGLASHLLTLTELTEAFQDFDIIIARDEVRDVREGRGHTGTAAVSRFLVRKPG